ncbi:MULTISPECIES: glycosyltransferase [Rhodomicrobium]|uniref:glycosyltransferase n=1 Tax=Rhodomicrobium TaxID=1068 RepID=UPI000B4BD15F|nr:MULTISPECIES: glycosyltransferase [Rhodomicrobium]
MKTILHISADFPDPLVPGKTKAVASLIEAASGFRHLVYSLNRVSWRSGLAARAFGEQHTALAYGAPPYGVRMTHHLTQIGDFILADLARRGVVPDLIHAHKLTVEGLIADRLATETGTPFITSLWGGTDRRVFEAKPGLRAAYRALARRAALLLPAAPWTADYFAAALDLDPSRFELLPITTVADTILPPVHCAKPRLMSAFAFEHWKLKGFDTLVQAIAQLSREVPEVELHIYGRGGPRALLDMTALIRKFGMAERVKIMDPLEHGTVQSVMNFYGGFVMPSRPETFGMVYVEAVLAGVPILWSRHEGVDGLFDGMNVGYRCTPNSVEDVTRGLRTLITDQARLKQDIARLQSAGAFEPLRREAIGARYRRLLAIATGERAEMAA